MTLQAKFWKATDGTLDYTPTVDRVSGEVVQTADGQAGICKTAIKATKFGALTTMGIVDFSKAANVNLLDGQQVFWDDTNNVASFTGDFPIGRAFGDAAAADAFVKVEMNVAPAPRIDLGNGNWVEDAALGLGVTDIGHGKKLEFDATAEIAMAALYSEATVPIAAGPIFEAEIAVFDIGDNAALDINFGLANGTHATDFDSVGESAVFHLDGNALDIKAESDDGTTEVSATDTTVDAVDDTYHLYQVDARDPADVKMYVDGIRVLSGTTFVLTAATGPLLAIVHLEKTSDNTLADVRVRKMTVRAGKAA